MATLDSSRPIAVFFDGDGTLWDFQAVMRRAMAETIEELVRRRPGLSGDLSVEVFVADRDDAAREHPDEVSHERLRELGFARSLQRLHVDDAGLATDLTAFFMQRRFAGVAVYPDVEPCLRRLRDAGIRVGLLSNGNTYPDRVGLDHLFDAVVFAHDVGAPKPDPRMYAAAEAALPSDQYVMVGDDLIDDVAAPQQRGWTGVWLNRTGDVGSTVTPDLTMPTLATLPTALRRLGAGAASSD